MRPGHGCTEPHPWPRRTVTVQVRAADTSLRNSDHEPLNYSSGSSVQITIDDP